MKLIKETKAEIPDLHFEEVDITERPEVAVKYRVMFTPAIAINGRLAFTGVPRPEALLARLQSAAQATEREW